MVRAFFESFGPTPAGKVLINHASDCCATFAAKRLVAQALTAGLPYTSRRSTKKPAVANYCASQQIGY